MSSRFPLLDLPVAPGELLMGKYRMGDVLGAGGMGVVVAAEHVQLGQRVAVKFLPREMRGKPEAVARFEREARAAAQIRSEHVVRVLDVSTPTDPLPYIVMEYLEGQDLAQLVSTRGRLPFDEAIGYVLQACEAVAEAHAAGIVHRDLKPGNLFLTKRRDGSPLIKVLDFGISKLALGGADVGGGGSPSLTSTTMVMGSPHYMSPEQVRSAKSVDARSDIWALGVILHELVSGRPVFDADSTTGVLAMIVADPPLPLRRLRPDVPAELEATVLACLQKQASDRPQDIAALARRLARLAPRWASVSVERILGALAFPNTDNSPSAPRLNAGGRGDSGKSPTTAHLSGEVLPRFAAGTQTLGHPAAAARSRPQASPAPAPPRRGFALTAGVVLVVGGAAAIFLLTRGAPAGRPDVRPAMTAPAPRIPALPPTTEEPKAPPPLDVAEPVRAPAPPPSAAPEPAPTPSRAPKEGRDKKARGKRGGPPRPSTLTPTNGTEKNPLDDRL